MNGHCISLGGKNVVGFCYDGIGFDTLGFISAHATGFFHSFKRPQKTQSIKFPFQRLSLFHRKSFFLEQKITSFP